MKLNLKMITGILATQAYICQVINNGYNEGQEGMHHVQYIM